MKTIFTVLIAICTVISAFAQGRIAFRNDASTMILANGIPMPPSEQFFFALFLAPETTVSAPGMTVSFADPSFQFADSYTTNNPHPLAAGRLIQRTVVLTGTRWAEVGLVVDFVVRGWSANAGQTWSEALANWNNGAPLVPMYIGSSTVGNDLLPALGTLPDPVIFGNTGQGEVPGFNMPFIPEPSTAALALLGGLSLLREIGKRRRRPE